MSRYRVIDSDDAATEAAPLEPDENAFRVTRPLRAGGYRRLATLLAERPDAWLHLWDQQPDLEALTYFPELGRLMVTNLRLESWEGLRHVASSLEELSMGDTTLRRISIAPMSELRCIRTLGLIGPVKDVDTLAGLTTVEELSLRSIGMPDLALVRPMRLRSLWIGVAGPTDMSILQELPSIEELELWRIRGLADVSVLGRLPRVRELRLQSMSSITALPSLHGATSLRVLALDTMRGITDLAPVADAPALEELLLIGMNQLQPDALRPLVGHPTLRRGIWGLGSTRRNVAAYDILPLGDPPYGHPSFRVAGEGGARA